MADSQSNARLRADAGAPTSGVIHVRTRLTADFTVISNALAQRRGSAVTVGVAVYILSLPTGTSVTIAALCEHFTEGEILISRALRELEAAGYLERRRERLSTGQIRTRTYFYDVPGGDPDADSDADPDADPDGPPEPPEPPKPRRPRKQPASAAAVTAAYAAVEETVAAPVQAEAETPLPLADADPRAIAVLAALRRVDPRLVVSAQEAARLAPAVTRWLAAGLLPTQITDHLTTGLPDRLLVRPVGILAYRLKETPLPAPARSADRAEPAVRPAVASMRNCDGCDRGFRSAEHSRCRDCRSGDHLRAAS
ncbi:uncharacterized protein SGFS_067140 [Streptomyces graminofaciens]|uniref:DNA-binding protein n=1 Tax=Streptomyces graminofaciens TaxID=68212 RepID=A0ABN5VS94_9ACTN|nr:hypothetical protein [Streptomyces graminofaciens]BBC35420.1 uncharacterized protein SGFS_067140 [Streptomyces graminofaciens]